MNTEGPKTPPLPPELIVRPVATIFSRASRSSVRHAHLGHERGRLRQRQVGRHADRARLHPAVAAGHHLGELQGDQADHQAPERGLDVPGQRQRMEHAVADAVEDPHVKPPTPAQARARKAKRGRSNRPWKLKGGTTKIGRGVMNSAKTE